MNTFSYCAAVFTASTPTSLCSSSHPRWVNFSTFYSSYQGQKPCRKPLFIKVSGK